MVNFGDYTTFFSIFYIS